jgi:hypothetical protein
MTQIINDSDFLNDSNENFLNKIKSLFVFNNFEEQVPHYDNKKNIIIVTNDDLFYALGENSLGCLGLGHNDRVKAPTLLEELCNKGVVELYNGLYHVFARNHNSIIYCWGYNNLGQLGKGFYNNMFYRPDINEYLSDKSIVNISCGNRHCLAITKFGDLYAWGWNRFGQVGNDRISECESLPIKLDAFNGEKIVSISCGSYHSMALTINGRAFIWGFNTSGVIVNRDTYDLNKPKLIEMNNIRVKSISCGYEHSLLLSSCGHIYVYDKEHCARKDDEEREIMPIGLNDNIIFTDLFSHINYDFSAALSIDKVFYALNEFNRNAINLRKTEFESLDELFAKECQITPHLTQFSLFRNIFSISDIGLNFYLEKYFSINNLENYEPSIEDKIKNRLRSEKKYQNEFKELQILGEGSFGSVYKVINYFDGKAYAIKKVHIESEFKNKFKSIQK